MFIYEALLAGANNHMIHLHMWEKKHWFPVKGGHKLMTSKLCKQELQLSKAVRMSLRDPADLCFPQLVNDSCRKPASLLSDTMFLHVTLSCISLITVVLNLIIIISVSHFRHKLSVTFWFNLFGIVFHTMFYKPVRNMEHEQQSTNVPLYLSSVVVKLHIKNWQIIKSWLLFQRVCFLFWSCVSVFLQAAPHSHQHAPPFSGRLRLSGWSCIDACWHP